MIRSSGRKHTVHNVYWYVWLYFFYSPKKHVNSCGHSTLNHRTLIARIKVIRREREVDITL